jgi:hypothetical protein
LTATALLLCLVLGCATKQDGSVVIVPHPETVRADAVPGDPFGSSSAAYEELRKVTDAALANPWDGELESFAGWLEAQTVSVERSLRMLKGIRVGPQDVYAVANGRIAMVYDQIAEALAEASALADAEGQEAEWTGQQDRIWEQSAAFWARCVRGCGMSGAHLDAWDLRCRSGLANSQTKTMPYGESKSPRQPK